MQKAGRGKTCSCPSAESSANTGRRPEELPTCTRRWLGVRRAGAIPPLHVFPRIGKVKYHRVLERRRAVALARHFREAEGLSIAQIAERLGRSPATIKAYFDHLMGEGARAQGALRGRVPGLRRVYPAAQRKGDAYAYGKACHRGRSSGAGRARV